MLFDDTVYYTLLKICLVATICYAYAYIKKAHKEVRVSSYYTASALGCRTVAYCTEIATLLHCGVALKLNHFNFKYGEVVVTCGRK